MVSPQPFDKLYGHLLLIQVCPLVQDIDLNQALTRTKRWSRPDVRDRIRRPAFPGGSCGVDAIRRNDPFRRDPQIGCWPTERVSLLRPPHNRSRDAVSPSEQDRRLLHATGLDEGSNSRGTHDAPVQHDGLDGMDRETQRAAKSFQVRNSAGAPPSEGKMFADIDVRYM